MTIDCWELLDIDVNNNDDYFVVRSDVGSHHWRRTDRDRAHHWVSHAKSRRHHHYRSLGG